MRSVLIFKYPEVMKTANVGFKPNDAMFHAEATSGLRPIDLFIPFRDAWPPVKEFMETGGELPKCIPWIKGDDLPTGTFPDPGEREPVTIS